MASSKFCNFGSIFIVACLGLTLLSGCSDIRRTMGIESKPSDEFMVSPAQKELEVPPDFSLLPPQSPSEAMPASSKGTVVQEEEALLKKKSLTASEKDVIKHLGPGLNLAGRAQLDEETLKEEAASKKQGPLGKALGLKTKAAKGEVIDPEEEQKRLQTLETVKN